MLMNLFDIFLAKGRTNYELHPESYALRDGVAQTMTLFKPRLVTVHRPTCLFHQQQLAAAGAAKQSPVTTPNRVRVFHSFHYGNVCFSGNERQKSTNIIDCFSITTSAQFDVFW